MDNSSPLEDPVIDLPKSVCGLDNKLSQRPDENYEIESNVPSTVEMGIDNDPKIIFSDENFYPTHRCHNFNIYLICATSLVWIIGTIVPKEIHNYLYPPKIKESSWYMTIQNLIHGPPEITTVNVLNELYALWAFYAVYFFIVYVVNSRLSNYDRREKQTNELIERKRKLKNSLIVSSTVVFSSAAVYIYRSYRLADFVALLTPAKPAPPPVPKGFFTEILINYLRQMLVLVGLPMVLGFLAQRKIFYKLKRNHMAAFFGIVAIGLAICYYTGYDCGVFESRHIAPLEPVKKVEEFGRVDIMDNLREFALYSLIGLAVILFVIAFEKVVMVFGQRISLTNLMLHTYQKIKISILALYATLKIFIDKLLEKYEGSINRKIFFALKLILRVTVFLRILNEKSQKLLKKGASVLMGFITTVVCYGKTIFGTILQIVSSKRILFLVTFAAMVVIASGWCFNDAVDMPVLQDTQPMPSTPLPSSPPEISSPSPEQEILFMVALPTSCLLMLWIFTVYTEIIIPLMTCQK
eukprot:TCONS_00037388-protein